MLLHTNATAMLLKNNINHAQGLAMLAFLATAGANRVAWDDQSPKTVYHISSSKKDGRKRVVLLGCTHMLAVISAAPYSAWWDLHTSDSPATCSAGHKWHPWPPRGDPMQGEVSS